MGFSHVWIRFLHDLFSSGFEVAVTDVLLWGHWPVVSTADSRPSELFATSCCWRMNVVDLGTHPE